MARDRTVRVGYRDFVDARTGAKRDRRRTRRGGHRNHVIKARSRFALQPDHACHIRLHVQVGPGERRPRVTRRVHGRITDVSARQIARLAARQRIRRRVSALLHHVAARPNMRGALAVAADVTAQGRERVAAVGDAIRRRVARAITRLVGHDQLAVTLVIGPHRIAEVHEIVQDVPIRITKDTIQVALAVVGIAGHVGRAHGPIIELERVVILAGVHIDVISGQVQPVLGHDVVALVQVGPDRGELAVDHVDDDVLSVLAMRSDLVIHDAHEIERAGRVEMGILHSERDAVRNAEGLAARRVADDVGRNDEVIAEATATEILQIGGVHRPIVDVVAIERGFLERERETLVARPQVDPGPKIIGEYPIFVIIVGGNRQGGRTNCFRAFIGKQRFFIDGRGTTHSRRERRAKSNERDKREIGGFQHDTFLVEKVVLRS